MNRVGIMQMVDTLMAGGMERVAVNLANSLPEERFCSHLCTTRQGGVLSESMAKQVHWFQLNRQSRFDVQAIQRLVSYIRANDIGILHAHGTSLFLAVAASLFKPHPVVLWHDHFGRNATEERPVRLYRFFAKRLSGAITVTQSLADWSRERLRLSANRVWYIPNFVCPPQTNGDFPALPGAPGSRIVCVANLRPQKDHLTLLRAMSLVAAQAPQAHLLLVGSAGEPACFAQIEKAMFRGNLAGRVSWLGSRRDVPAVLRQCAVGVLSSCSEGLPLALVEYGWARLPVVATRVGQCAEVLGEGQYGLLVPPCSPQPLAEALLQLLNSPPLRAKLGGGFYERVQRTYSPEAILGRLCAIYDTLLTSAGKGSPAAGVAAAR